MNHYIKQQSSIKRERKCKKTLFNSKNTYTSYATHLSSKFLISSPIFTQSINFKIGANLYTKPYYTIRNK
jgi:hypothetical protein